MGSFFAVEEPFRDPFVAFLGRRFFFVTNEPLVRPEAALFFFT